MLRILVLVLSSLISGRESVASSESAFYGNKESFLCDVSEGPTSWTFEPDNGNKQTIDWGSNGYTLFSGTQLVIDFINASHEGIYECVANSMTFNLTVIGLAFYGGCSAPTQGNLEVECGVSSPPTMVEKGSSILINVSFDFFGYGNRNKVQEIDLFQLFRSNGVGLEIQCEYKGDKFDCDENTDSSLHGRTNYIFPNKYETLIEVTNATTFDSGNYTIKAEVKSTHNSYYTITSYIFISVTVHSSTSGKLLGTRPCVGQNAMFNSVSTASVVPMVTGPATSLTESSSSSSSTVVALSSSTTSSPLSLIPSHSHVSESSIMPSSNFAETLHNSMDEGLIIIVAVIVSASSFILLVLIIFILLIVKKHRQTCLSWTITPNKLKVFPFCRKSLNKSNTFSSESKSGTFSSENKSRTVVEDDIYAHHKVLWQSSSYTLPNQHNSKQFSV